MQISEIWRYPIASLSGEPVPEARIDASGIVGDRGYSLVCERSGEVASPESAARWQSAPLVSARGQGADLCLRTPSTSWLPAFEGSAKAALDEHLGFPVALRRTGPYGSSQLRPDAVRPRYPRRPLHILSRRMLSRLQEIVPNQTVTARRFRANLVIDFAEDDERDALLPDTVLAFGDTRIRVIEPTVRCGFVALAQEGVDRSAPALKTIKREQAMCFGVYAEVIRPGHLATGLEADRASLRPRSMLTARSHPTTKMLSGAR
jgi:uncharacterized protein YcbX